MKDNLLKQEFTKKQQETLEKYNFSGDNVPPFTEKWGFLKILNDYEKRANMAVDGFASKWKLSSVRRTFSRNYNGRAPRVVVPMTVPGALEVVRHQLLPSCHS